jgi:hypothetical protein
MANLVSLTDKIVNPSTREIEAIGLLDTAGRLYDFQFTPAGSLKVEATIIDIGNVGILDSGDVRINPATEETLVAIKDQTDQFTFTGGALNVNATITFPSSMAVTQSTSPWVISGSVSVSNFPTTIDIGNFPTSINVGNFPTSITVNTITGFALESGGNLLTIKTNTDQFKFNGSDLKVELYIGAIAYDARQIRALVNSDVVSAEITKWIGSTAPSVGQKTMANSIPVVLPSDQTIPISVSSGGNLWQERTNASFGYIATTNVLTIATSVEQPFLLLKNPSGSGKNMRLEKIIFQSDANSKNVFRIYRNPTITANGTALTINNLRFSGSASIGTVYKISTTTSFGTLITPIIMLGSPAGSNTILDLDLGQFIEQNENLLITIDPSANGLSFAVTVYWVEV